MARNEIEKQVDNLRSFLRLTNDFAGKVNQYPIIRR